MDQVGSLQEAVASSQQKLSCAIAGLCHNLALKGEAFCRIRNDGKHQSKDFNPLDY